MGATVLAMLAMAVYYVIVVLGMTRACIHLPWRASCQIGVHAFLMSALMRAGGSWR